MSCCNSNCNHDPCGSSFNQALTKAAQYAQYAQTQANKAEDLWLEFNALYLGSFEVAPTTDNEGNPLQEGALYFNSTSNQMFVWQSGSWIDFGFDEFTPFLATGTTSARNLATRFAEVANVLDYGAFNDGTNASATRIAIQNAINSQKPVYFPRGSYVIDNTIYVLNNESELFCDAFGSARITLTNSSTATAFYIGNSDPVNDIYKPVIENLMISRLGTFTSFATGIVVERAQDLKMYNVGISQFAVCLDIKGGYNCVYNNLRVGAGSNADSGYGAIQIRAATSGTAFEGYTHFFTNCHISGILSDYALAIRGTDYISFQNSYFAAGKKGSVLVETNSQPGIGNYQNCFDNCYFDRVGNTDPNATGIYLNEGAKNSVGTKITDCMFTDWEIAVKINKSYDQFVEIVGNRFVRSRKKAIEATGDFTNLVITGNNFFNNSWNQTGNAAVDIIDIKAVTITGNIFAYDESSPAPAARDAIRLAGSIDTATITGNAFNSFAASGVTDLNNTATITEFVITGNSSDNATNTIVGHLIGNQANSNRFTLDWYEEFAFIPTLTFGGNSVGLVLSTTAAKATRIGDRVFFNIYLQLSNKGTSTGDAIIGGLPFSQSSSYPVNYTITCYNLNSAIGSGNIFSTGVAPTSIALGKQIAGTGASITDADFTNTTFLYIGGNYVAA